MMNFMVKEETKKTVDEAIKDLKTSLGNHNFGVLWEMNFKDKLKEKDVIIDDDFVILEVCNPKQAKQELEKNIDVGFFLPCKFGVYKSKGQVYIGMVKPTNIIDMLDDSSLMEDAKEIERELISAINEAK